MKPDHATLALDKRQLRRSFEKAALAYDDSTQIQTEVGRRLLEHLEPVRLAPARVLDVGTATGVAAYELLKRYRGADILGIDIALTMLRRARRRRLKIFSRPRFLCADASNLPIATESVDLIHSNLTLHWCGDPEPVLREFRRVLSPGGLLAFSTYGPDTLRELRDAFNASDRHVHVHAFLDMHDMGDALVRAGFHDVVMDVERITATYDSVVKVMQDLKSWGARNVALGRNPGLTGRACFTRMTEAYEQHRREGRLPATFEVIYAHAWRPEPRVVEVPLAGLKRARGAP